MRKKKAAKNADGLPRFQKTGRTDPPPEVPPRADSDEMGSSLPKFQRVPSEASFSPAYQVHVGVDGKSLSPESLAKRKRNLADLKRSDVIRTTRHFEVRKTQ